MKQIPKDRKQAYTIHPTAEVQTERIGAQTRIWQFSVVLAGASIGKNCNINAHCFIENDVVIGNNVTVKCGVYLWDALRIEDNVFIGPNVTFTNDNYPRSKQYPKAFLPVIIRKGASLGSGVIVSKGGLTIGRHAMVGAGSIVTKDIPDFNLWYGTPARFKAYLCRCGQKLGDGLSCPTCKAQYKKWGEGLREYTNK